MIKDLLIAGAIGTGLNIASLFSVVAERLNVGDVARTQLDRGFPFSYLENVNQLPEQVAQGSGFDITAALSNQAFWVVIGLGLFLLVRYIYKAFSKLVFVAAIAVIAAIYFGFLSLA